MREERLLALVGLLLAIVGALLLILAGARLPRNLTLDNVIQEVAIPIVLGLTLLLGALALGGRQYTSGGVVCLVVGIVALVLGQGLVEALLALVGGIMGLVAGSLRTRRLEVLTYRR